MNLSESGYSRAHLKASALSVTVLLKPPRGDMSGSAPDRKAHVALENIYELRQLVETRRPYYLADAGHAAVALI